MRFLASVITGHGIGRQLGYPTLNFAVPTPLDLGEGVFSCRVLLAGDWQDAVLFFGRRATFADAELSLEVHVLDWAENMQITQTEIEIFSKIREPQKFSSRDELIAAIAQDCQQARNTLAHRADNL